LKILLLASLRTIIKALVGSLNYERIQSIVADTDSVAVSGDEKRALVVMEARTVGLAVGYALLNLAIEIAVQSLRK